MLCNVERRYEAPSPNNYEKCKRIECIDEKDTIFGFDTISQIQNESDNVKKLVDKIMVKTHRFTFSPALMEHISVFAIKHQCNDRSTFKLAWEKWIKRDDISVIIKDETAFLKNTGFKGDVMDKMFTSARYYFRKKVSKKTADKEKNRRKKHEGLGAKILQQMDAHILQKIKKSTTLTTSGGGESILSVYASPSASFENYCLEYKDQIVEQAKTEADPTTTISKSDMTTVFNKFKKTYKNRFYIMKKILNETV